jgi:5,10-methylenetetrahydromethanopterin reductase
MRRVGIAFTGQPYSVRQIIAAARAAEEAGFESVWIGEDNWTGRDSISILSALALSTHRIRLGTSVVNPYTRHPVLLAMTFNALSELAPDRLVLGMGSGIGWKPLVASQIAERPPIRALREAIHAIRHLLKGDNITWGDEVISFAVSRPGFEGGVPPFARGIPVYMGAVRPRVTELAGEIADGLLLETGTRRDAIPARLEHLAAGAARAKRDPKSIDIAAILVTGASENGTIHSNTLGYVAKEVALLEEPEAQKLGFEPERSRRVKEEYLRGDYASALRLLSPDMISTFTVAGAPSDCLRIIEEFVQAGVNLPILLPFGGDLNTVIGVGARYAKGK